MYIIEYVHKLVRGGIDGSHIQEFKVGNLKLFSYFFLLLYIEVFLKTPFYLELLKNAQSYRVEESL
jgi:hypothetical protein